MPETEYRGRRAVSIENEQVRVTVTVEGGHIAEILHKPTGVNPLWTPPWPSMEPSLFDPARDTRYGTDAEARLLAGIMGHNLCLDLFGGPTREEAAAGLTVHGEASVNAYEIDAGTHMLTARTTLASAQLVFERRLLLEGETVRVHESVENLARHDRPVGWTQHVTLGPPFIAHGKTRFELTATRSKTYESPFGESYAVGQEFDWPLAPTPGGSVADLRTYSAAQRSAGYTAHLMDPSREQAFFTAWSPESGVLFGYRWRRSDFPWCGLWEENRFRSSPPWNGETVTRGVEFGVSPMPESRRAMIERASLFGVPAYRWIPAGARVRADYEARITTQSEGDLQALWRGR